ncbi:MAG: flagellar basal body P-ring protein FlgI [Pirellulaceae bacterium]
MFGRKPIQTTRWLSFAIIASMFLCQGCTTLLRGKAEKTDDERLNELMNNVPDAPKLIRTAAVPRGMQPIVVEGVGVVNGLPGTGGPADPSPFRDQLLEEMKRNDVAKPNQFLELDETALVRVRAMIPPGARRGDPMDVILISPPRSRVSDLHGGWLFETRMRHQQVLQSTLRQSDVMAMSIGPVLTRSDHESGTDDALRIEGRILSGGRVQNDRNLGLILRPDFQHVKMASKLTAAVNHRFFFFDGSTRRGIAKAKEDDFIEIEVHPRYRGNEYRLMSVILSLGANVGDSESQQRLSDLRDQLGDPATASDAALQLEAIGENAIPTLLTGLESDNPELRFYAAQSLAFLDQTEAIEPLEDAARSVPAFRHAALAALQSMPQQLAIDALKNLFDQPSLETRYGAFVAIRRRDDGQRKLVGESVEQKFRLYQVSSDASPAVVLSLREAPEVVLFGNVAPLSIDGFLLGPDGLILKPEPSNANKIRVSRFCAGKDDRRIVCDNTVASLAKAIVGVGGGYGDVVSVLRTAKDKGFLTDQLAINPLPKAFRTYYRDGVTEQVADEEDDSDSIWTEDKKSL